MNSVLKDKTILVTGATGNLGAAMTRGLAKAGARVLVNGRSIERVNDLVEKVQASGGDAKSAVFDIRDGESVTEYFQQMENQHLHALVNNAYCGNSGSIEYSSTTDYRDSYDISVVAAHRLVLAGLPSLRLAASSGGASVINVCSMFGMVSPDLRVYGSPESANPPYYGAAKGALIQWTRYAACEFGRENIRFNAVSPGPFPSIEVRAKNPEFVDRLEQRVPMGRIGSAEEIAGPIVFLASNASSYVNGSNLLVDGGWTCW